MLFEEQNRLLARIADNMERGGAYPGRPSGTDGKPADTASDR